MGRNSSGGGGARGGGSSGSSGSGDAGGVNASVAGYSDLVTPRGMTISHAGTIKLRQPKTVDQANKMITAVEKAHSIAKQEQQATSGLKGNDPRKVASSLRVNHTSQALSRVVKMAKKLTK